MATVQQIKELYKVIKQNGQTTTAKCIVGANANIYTNLGINLSGTTAVPRPYSVMIGQNSLALDDHSIAIGKGAYAKGGCVAIGQYSTMTQSDDFKVVIGDGSANANHNCFTSDGSIVTLDNNIVNIGNNASVVSIGNRTSSRVVVGEGTDSTVRIGNETVSYVAIGNGNSSTVRIGDNVNAQVGIGNKTGCAVNIGNGDNSWVYLGYGATSSHVSIGEGSNSTVWIGKSFAGVNIWDASNILFNSPASNIYIPIKFDDCEVHTSSTTQFMATIPLEINGIAYTLHNIPKDTRYKITVDLEADVPWGSQRLSVLSLADLASTQSQVIPKENGSDKNDNRYARSVFTTTRTMVYSHSNLYLYIDPPAGGHTTYNYTIMITMYIPLKSLALALMETNFS